MPFTNVPALVDTGASRTVLTPAAVEKVGLRLMGYEKVARAGGVHEAGVYAASIQFPSHRLGPIEMIPVLCTDLPSQPIQCLLGRDVLSRWKFTYDGRTGDWWIEEDDTAIWVEPPDYSPT